ncbi:hypothetical protein AX774_g1207 [Zancudomyces culisetae]|uniref:Uncharacterized protein n=1 Tax=Zancudomyces culisetae TaxID=1213189 RepID=A0A1R1PWE9_ZANCU|nr:hypothetical protein AX774_g1207 [Zancudomyces culisetae]|eukprot:OMH85254.1 hypothetical protein AX774_g1207 [Zancudomyces culisetae]
MGSMAMRNVNVMGMNYRMPMGMPMGGMPIANPAVQMQMMGSMPFMNPMRSGIPMQQSGMHMGTIGGVGGVGQFKPASQSQPATPQSSSSTQIVGQKRKPTEHLPDDREGSKEHM